MTFVDRVNHVIRTGDPIEVNKLVAETIDPVNPIESRITHFDILIQSIQHPAYYSEYILTHTDDVLIVEKLFETLDYIIPSGLNTCLNSVSNMEILRYIVFHPYAMFDISYMTFEPLRMAVMGAQLERLSLFVSAYGTSLNVHVRGLSTMDKSSVEIAVMFGYDDVILIFHDAGLTCSSEYYSDDTNEYIRTVIMKRSLEKVHVLDAITDLYLKTDTFDDELFKTMFAYTYDPLTRLSNTASLIIDICRQIDR
jgi:hypothetical protein